MVSNPVVRYNVEDFELRGAGNVARRNCLWSTRHPDRAGVQPDITVPVQDSVVAEPAFTARGEKDFRVAPGSECFDRSPGDDRPGPP